tara:strand:+ start:481 stop:705 length:225 start_codon:yes stop_codon:yes gene_type:complete
MEECKNEIVDKVNQIKNEKQMKKERKKMDKLMKEYVATFLEKDQLAYKIAQEHLKSSFCLEKSIGFNKWLKDRE